MPSRYIAPKLSKLILILALGSALIFFVPQKIWDPVRGALLRIAYPFQKTFYIISERTGDFFVFLGYISELKTENEKLIRENNSMSAKIVQILDQKKENEVLRKQLDLAPRGSYDLEASLVIGQDSRGSGFWIMIDKGTSRGISTGMPVVVSDGILVGKVSETFENSSRVVLLTDSSISLNVADSETGAKGIVKGEYGLGLVMSMVEQTAILNAGDSVVTSNLGGSLPGGLFIGKIQQSGSSPDKLFQQAVVIPQVKYSNLDLVFVIKGVN